MKKNLLLAATLLSGLVGCKATKPMDSNVKVTFIIT